MEIRYITQETQSELCNNLEGWDGKGGSRGRGHLKKKKTGNLTSYTVTPDLSCV